MQADIYLLDRVELDNKIIRLGMYIDEVFKIMGKGETYDNSRFYYYNSELAIDFDDNDRVEYIEFLAGEDGNLQPILNGVALLKEKAETVKDMLLQINKGEIEEEENYGISYLEISVGLYREDENSATWDTFGFGVSDYYR